jgi:NAD(P)H dehydrogenase (quinone)
MILLTGASGKTGKAILSALKQRGVQTRVLVRSAEQASELSELGAADAVVGDLRDQGSLNKAIKGCDRLYYICPNVTPDEAQIGKTLLEIAKKEHLKQFVYHSVLHSQIEAMPHHWQKMRMEEALFESGMDFTILQPCAYMQNILGSWKSVTETGIYPVPYATTARISIVDLLDVAAAAALILSESGYENAIYELAGPQPLTQDEVAATLSKILGRSVTAKAVDRSAWAENARSSGNSEYQVNTLLMMFEYYENYGLIGNSNTLSRLLNRSAATFEEFIKRQVANSLH